jgi:hypothetical protein
MRRFCRCSPGVDVTLHVNTGATPLGEQIRDERPDLVVVCGSGETEAGKSAVLDAALEGPAPVLIVPSLGHDRQARDPRPASRGV